MCDEKEYEREIVLRCMRELICSFCTNRDMPGGSICEVNTSGQQLAKCKDCRFSADNHNHFVKEVESGAFFKLTGERNE